MHNPTSAPMIPRPLERVLAVAGALICLVVTAVLWVNISANQPMWPFPALYFIEMAALGLVCALLEFINGGPNGQFILWGSVGIFTAFSILGAFSVGFFYLPVAIIFGVAAILYDVRNKQKIAAHIGVCLAAGLLQVLLTLLAARLFF